MTYTALIALLGHLGFGFHVAFTRDEYEDGMPVTRILVSTGSVFLAAFSADGTFETARWHLKDCTADELIAHLQQLTDRVERTQL